MPNQIAERIKTFFNMHFAPDEDHYIIEKKSVKREHLLYLTMELIELSDIEKNDDRRKTDEGKKE